MQEKLKDSFGIIGFVLAVVIGAIVINSFFFRTFSVIGPSMEDTLHTNDRLIVSRLQTTGALITRNPYVPGRGAVIVFKNPLFGRGHTEEFVVKRVIGLPGETVKVEDGSITVYNDENPDGFKPDNDFDGPKSPTTGEIETTVPDDAIFVAGDNRQGNFSLDSRNGMGTVPLSNIQGPVILRFYPFDQIRTF